MLIYAAALHRRAVPHGSNRFGGPRGAVDDENSGRSSPPSSTERQASALSLPMLLTASRTFGRRRARGALFSYRSWRQSI
jgi:hypothetical protein